MKARQAQPSGDDRRQLPGLNGQLAKQSAPRIWLPLSGGSAKSAFHRRQYEGYKKLTAPSAFLQSDGTRHKSMSAPARIIAHTLA